MQEQEGPLWRMLLSRTLQPYEKEATLLREVNQAEPDDEEQTDCGAGVFQRVDLDVEYALGGTNLS